MKFDFKKIFVDVLILIAVSVVLSFLVCGCTCIARQKLRVLTSLKKYFTMLKPLHQVRVFKGIALALEQ